MLIDAVYVLLSYLVGALPAIYLLAKSRGVDLHATGSRNVGATNLWAHAGPGMGILGTAIDFLKGVVPPLAAQALGLRTETVALSGLAAMVGQIWPVFLGFRGGRGNLTGVGAFLALIPGALLFGSIPVLVGAIAKWIQRVIGWGRPDVVGVALGVLVGAMVLLAACWSRPYPPIVKWVVTSITLLFLLRRLTAELRLDLQAPRKELLGILATRLLLDRPKV